MKIIKTLSIIGALLTLNLSAVFADGIEDDSMIEIGDGQSVKEESFTPETHDMEPITIKDETTGQDVVGGYLVTEKDTGEQMLVGAGETPEIAKFRLNLIVRIKFPELVGVRAGIEYDSFIEAGIDIGVGLFFNNTGLYTNVYPMHKKQNALKGLYVGGRVQKEVIWAIFGTITGTRVEGVVGYRGLWGKKKLWFGFIELGMGQHVGNVKDVSVFGNYSSSSVHPADPLPLPVVALGVGYSIGKRR